jgi:uncharacterized protein YdiU (UPF0061 family)
MTKIPFLNSYGTLPPILYSRLAPTSTRAPRLRRLNTALAASLGIDVDAPSAEKIFAGNLIPDGADPMALAYAGHQFGHFVPQLGDGRALLLGEVIDSDGIRRDIQLKGAGRTPYSRGGDGRAAIGPVLREYLVSEAMAALGIPTTRALAAVTTGEEVFRETPLPGAVFTRIAASHIRVGTFQYAALQPDIHVIRQLADYVIARHYPAASTGKNPYLSLLDMVVARQADLVARWLLVGFIHGVMNTDNTAISGETIDYGPCAFMDAYDPATVFSSIDHQSRYAYANQPRIIAWNLARFAETLLPLLADNQDQAIGLATEAIEQTAPLLQETYRSGLLQKLGISAEREGDTALAQDFLNLMQKQGADFTSTFRRLAEDQSAEVLADPDWTARWWSRLAAEKITPEERRRAMLAVNPVYIPRNHLVEEALSAAVTQNDFSPFETLLEVLAKPFDARAGHERYASPPQADQRVYQTFCGT